MTTQTNTTLVEEAKERLRRYLNANSDLHEATVIDNDDQEDSPTFGDLRTLLTSLPTDDDDTVTGAMVIEALGVASPEAVIQEMEAGLFIIDGEFVAEEIQVAIRTLMGRAK